eukprot:GHVH01002961.1.p1 GENE.GHVH01002961.1~~GHVH01002961.1.p1  ORF type:complete len:1737 (+),score=279.49 GHVH01002961.1:4068-9278(+)
MLDLNDPYSPCEVKSIETVEFGILDQEFLKKQSVVEIDTTELYVNGQPKPGGLNDLRMGSADPRFACKTCGQDCKLCPGHFGHLTLAKPVYHQGFLKAILSTLRCVCHSCSRLLADRSDPKFHEAIRIKNSKSRMARIAELSKSKKICEGSRLPNASYAEEEYGGCGQIQPKYTIVDSIKISLLFAPGNSGMDDLDGIPDDGAGVNDMKRHLTAEEALAIVSKISDDDLRVIGLDPVRSRPSFMILETLAVPPPCVRPYVVAGAEKSEDDLTLKLVDIMKINQQLVKQEAQGAPDHLLTELAELLHYHVTTFFNNEIPGLPVTTTRTKKPIRSIRQRLKGKDGRVRGNLMGKRVDFSARTVITGDPNLEIDQVGVPRSIAMNLTFPEVVTALNISRLKELIRNGPSVHPGAKYVEREDGVRFDLRHCAANPSVFMLEVGYKVERHMCDGDFVLFNRQPSLHKMSIMGHRVKVLPWSTFRLNLSVTSPYNADFDGDEMNLHLAQGHETRAEIKYLMSVTKNIVSAQSNKPVMGIVQDSLLGIMKLTRRDSFLKQDEMMQLLVWIQGWRGKMPTPCILKPVELWSGKQVVSQLLAFEGDIEDGGDGTSSGCSRINLQRDGSLFDKEAEHPFMSPNDGRIIIRNSEHLTGTICKKTVGSTSGGLIHILFHEVGSERTRTFLSECQKVVNTWLQTKGFTVGVSDIIPNQLTMDRVAQTIEVSEKKVAEYIKMGRDGSLENQPGKSLLQSFESRVNQELNEARERAGRIGAESLDMRNNIIAMVYAGSKGSTINISQIISCVGQQNVEGMRIPFCFTDRSLPHYTKHDYGPESRGFVKASYLSGLSPQEVFFHAMGGREGIIDTACKTSETGYIQRRLIKAMEDVIVSYDRTVRNSQGEIIQFLYGEDGMDGSKIEDQNLWLMNLSHDSIKDKFSHDFDNPLYGQNFILNDQIRKEILGQPEYMAVLAHEFDSIVQAKRLVSEDLINIGEARQHLPINLTRIIESAKARFGTAKANRLNLNPVNVATKVDHLLKYELEVIRITSDADSISTEVQNNATMLISAHLRPHLSSRNLMENHKLGESAIKWILEEVKAQFQRALCHPGESVGALAAQSIGEPATQMTLNTFHFAGVGSKNVTLGVPRLKELINVAKTVKTPSLTVYLQPQFQQNQMVAKNVQAQLEHTNLAAVTAYTEIIFDPDPTTSIVRKDAAWVADCWELEGDELNPNTLGRWVLRIVLIERSLSDKNISMKEIGRRIERDWPRDLHVIWTDDNASDLVLRIRQKSVSDVGDEEEDGNRLLQKLMTCALATISLRGVDGIQKVFMREDRYNKYNKNGNFSLEPQWVLDTDGCNLKDVLGMGGDVDTTRTTSNKITEIAECLGIEATRRTLMKELHSVLSFDGSYVNHRHLSILVDVMTQRGHLTSITRNGINRVNRGALAKCSFEETVEILFQAATHAETDALRGVTENIILGQLAPFGTGCCDILIDEAKLKDTREADCLIAEPGAGGGLQGFLEGSSQYGDSVTSRDDMTASPSPYDNVVRPFSPHIKSPSSAMSPSSPTSNPFSPGFQPMSPGSPGLVQHPFSPLSPGGTRQLSPTVGGQFSPNSPMYNPTSPMLTGGIHGDLMSPQYALSPNSPTLHQRAQDVYDPASPNFNSNLSRNQDILSPAYSPRSPSISPQSPVPGGMTGPMSPGAYSITSQHYSPTSPFSPSGFDITSPLGPTSPVGPTSPYSPTSPNQELP